MDKNPMLNNINVQDLMKNVNTQDLLKNIQPNSLPSINIDRNKEMDDAVAKFHRQQAEDRQVQKNIEANTKKIAENTEWLCQSVNLIRINSERQTELLQILSDVFALTNSKDEEEAEGKLKQILDSVQGFKENYELIMFLKKMGTALIKFAFTGEVNLPD